MPLDSLSDGFVKICFDPSLNYFEGKSSIVVEGQYVVNGSLATAIVPDTVIEVQPRYIDEMFTAGSVLAEGLKAVLCACGENTKVFALPRADGGSGVKAVYTLAITGPATTDGLIDIWLGGEPYSIEGVIVNSGDTATIVATAIQAAIPARFPYVVTRSTSTLTFTARNAGTVGNFLNPVINWKARQNYLPAGLGFTVTRTTPGSVDPVAPDYAAAFGDCCYDVFALLSGDATWQNGLRDFVRDRWDCAKPQCFGQGYTYNSGSLGTVLATGNNSAELVRVPVPLNDVAYPWLMVADYAGKSACTAKDNPELSIQGPEFGLLSCNKRPMSCALPWTFDEQTQLKAAGFAVYVPAALGRGGLTYCYISNDVTNYLYDDLGRENTTYRDANSRRMAKRAAVEFADKLRETQGLAFYTKNTRIPQGVFGINKRLLLGKLQKWVTDQIGRLWSSFDNLEKDLIVQEDFEVKPPCQGVPCKVHVQFTYRPPCRLNQYEVTMRPKMIDNCVR